MLWRSLGRARKGRKRAERLTEEVKGRQDAEIRRYVGASVERISACIKGALGGHLCSSSVHCSRWDVMALEKVLVEQEPYLLQGSGGIVEFRMVRFMSL